MTENDLNPGGTPHRAFWETMSYEDFTTGNVAGVTPAVKILIVGKGLDSALVQSLMGVGLFDPSGAYGQMPAFAGPYMQPAGPTVGPMVQPIVVWIDAGCPKCVEQRLNKALVSRKFGMVVS